MQLSVNGTSKELPQDATIRDLVVQLGLANRPVAVEVNKQLVPHRQHEQTKLSDGDQVEIVTLVGGG
jgi:sulfur carrier protein